MNYKELEKILKNKVICVYLYIIKVLLNFKLLYLKKDFRFFYIFII